VPDGSRFCLECGQQLAEGGETLVRPPSHHLWPPDPFIVISGALIVGAIVLFIGQIWAWGVVAFLAAIVVFLGARAEERRAARYALGGLGARFSAGRDSIAARSRGQIELFRIRRELAELEGERNRALQRLGHAVFYEDRVEAARAGVQEVVDRIDAKEAELQALIERTEERVHRAQAGVRATEKLEAPPEPARVPEPWPPPDEGEPPQPAEVPEPSPDQPAPEPEPAPTPQVKARKPRKAASKAQKR